MSKEAVFTMKLEPELRTAFMTTCNAAHRPASQVIRDLMREFIQRQQEVQEYNEFLRCKVEAGRTSMLAGLGRSNEDVEAEFTNRRLNSQDQEKRMRVVWTPEALQDRMDVWGYIANHNPHAAIRMDELFSDAASRLADQSMLGKVGKISNTRELIPHENYRLVYEIYGETVWIPALIHTARRWPPIHNHQ